MSQLIYLYFSVRCIEWLEGVNTDGEDKITIRKLREMEMGDIVQYMKNQTSLSGKPGKGINGQEICFKFLENIEKIVLY